MTILEMIKKMNNGMTQKELEAELRQIDLKKSKEKGKCFGTCDSCDQETVLVEGIGLCGPCCFGEADTANGEW